MEEGRKYRKTKHPQIDLSALSLLRKEPYYLNKESLQKCSEPGDGIYEFEKWVERDGCQDGVYGSRGKGSKVYFKHDLRSHDGFLAFSYNEEPSVRNLANIGSVKTSLIMEHLSPVRSKMASLTRINPFRLEFVPMRRKIMGSKSFTATRWRI